MPTQPALDITKAIEFGQLVNAIYAASPGDLTNKAGQALSAGGVDYIVVTTIYANDLATDMNPGRVDDEVSIGLICQVDQAGDVAIALRGTEGTAEWVHDAEFLQVPCPLSVLGTPVKVDPLVVSSLFDLTSAPC